jgi:hypothetical protein
MLQDTSILGWDHDNAFFAEAHYIAAALSQVGSKLEKHFG